MNPAGRAAGRQPSESRARTPRGGDESINLAGELARISEYWRPRTVTAVNDYDVRLVRVRGEYPRHQHPDSDAFFLVIGGELCIGLDGGRAVRLGPGEVHVVPAGTYHRPAAHVETSVLLFLPRTAVPAATAHHLTSRRAHL